MKLAARLVAAAITLALVPATAFPTAAHEGHDEVEPISQVDAIAKAKAVVQTMIGRKVLEANWSGQPVTSARLKQEGYDPAEWIIVFRNDAVKEPTKQTLFVFLRGDGEYVAANYTGK